MTQADRIASVLSRGALTVREIAAQTGLSMDIVRVVLNRHQGRFVNVREGRARAGLWGLILVRPESVT